MSDPSEPEPKQPPDDEEDDWRFEFELRDLPDLGGLRERGPVDAGEINDLGTGDDPPRSGE